MTSGKHRQSCWLIASLLICFAGNGIAKTSADQPNTKPLVTGDRLQKALLQRQSISYQESSLGKSLRELQANTGICILLDRRVDPTITVNLTTPFVTSREVIEALARHVGMSASFCETYTLIGPASATGKTKTLSTINRKSISGLRRKMDEDVYRKLVDRKPRSWPRLSQPAQLILDAAESIGIELENSDRIPHDVWAEATLPPMPFCDFASLLLIQFNLSFEVTQDGLIRIISAPEDVGIKRSHRVAASDKAAAAQRLDAAFPDLGATWRGNTISVVATVEMHEFLEQLIKNKRLPDSNVGFAGFQTQLFTFKVPTGTPLSAIVAQFRQRGVPIRIEGITEEEANKVLEQTVQLDLKQVEGREFFPKVFAGLNVTVIVQENAVILQF